MRATYAAADRLIRARVFATPASFLLSHYAARLALFAELSAAFAMSQAAAIIFAIFAAITISHSMPAAGDSFRQAAATPLTLRRCFCFSPAFSLFSLPADSYRYHQPIRWLFDDAEAYRHYVASSIFMTPSSPAFIRQPLPLPTRSARCAQRSGVRSRACAQEQKSAQSEALQQIPTRRARYAPGHTMRAAKRQRGAAPAFRLSPRRLFCH